MSRSRPTKAELAIRVEVDAEMGREAAERAARKASVLASPGGAEEWERIRAAERAEISAEYRASIQQYQQHVAEQKARQEKAQQARASATPLCRVPRVPTRAQQARVDRLAAKVGALTTEWEERKAATLALPDGAARWERAVEEDRATGRTMYRENAVRWLAIGKAQLAAKWGNRDDFLASSKFSEN